MPHTFKSLRSAALLVVLLPILAITQQTPPAGKQGPPTNPPAGQQTPPGNPPAGPQTPPKGAPGTAQTPPAGATKTTTVTGAATQTHPNGGTPVEVGDAWDSLKLDPKVRIKLSFRNAHIDNIIEMLQKASHITIVKDPVLNGPMTVTTADPVSLSEAFHVFNSVLKLKGYEISRDRKILVITVLKKPQPPQPPPMPIVMPAPGPDPNAEIVKFYPLMYANASQVARAINEVFLAGAPNQQQQQFGMVFGNRGQQGQPPPPGPAVRVSYEDFSNSIIVNAPPAQQAQVEALIKEIDKRQTEPQRTKVYKLVFATAGDILSSVQNVLSSNLGKGKGAKDVNPLLQIFGFGSGQNQNLAVADSRTNSIMVTGTDDLLLVADQVIADLDQRMPFTSTTFVFKLQNARADTVANLLTAAYGQRQGSQTNNTKTVITPTNNTFTNTTSSSSASHSLAQKAAAAAAAAQAPQSMPVGLQDPNAESGNLMTNVGVTQGFFGYYGGQDGGGGGGGRNRNSSGTTIGHDQDGKVIGVHDLTGQVTAVADPNTNSVIVVTQPDNVDLIKDVLDQLDKIPEQVMIQTIIVEATLDKAKQFGLEWNFAQNKAFGNTGTTGTGSQNFGLQTANPPLQGFNYTLTGGDLTAFFNMLQTDTNFQVLSTPRIFTSNNMEAQINISQSIPYIVSTIENTNGTTSFNYAFQDVGIVLTVTPHITSNGYVTMDVLQTANDLQGYTTFNAPIVNQREAETTISAKDGETIILGGMIRNQVTSTVNKVPLLGDLPILGNLFRSTNNDHQKTELLVFLTPRVVRDPAEAKKLKDESQNEVSPGMKKIMQDELAKAKAKGN